MHPFLRLMRLNQPTGIWLLLWPCWWGIALAGTGLPSFRLFALFGVGAALMRGAGCIINDIIDREFDKQVERTRMRPLASGEVKLAEAIILLSILLCIALIIALQMNNLVLLLAAGSLILVAAYPFMKRITWWPQAFLGLTFNWGALMGWGAVRGNIGWPAVALYAGGVFWTLGYDTIYAHQDRADDQLIGVKSTALRLGARSREWIIGFYTLAVILWLMAGYLNQEGLLYLIGMAGVSAHFFYQVHNVNFNAPGSCMKIFRSNALLGGIMLVATLMP